MKLIQLNRSHKTKNSLTHFAKIDDEDFERVNQFNWSLTKSKRGGYYARMCLKGTNKQIKLHRFILKITDPKIKIDHEDRDGLNCQKNNLRIATQSQNMKNRIAWGTSNYLGVCRGIHSYYKGKPYYYWLAQIKTPKHFAKRFPFTPEGEKQAALWYNEKAIKYHGEFARLNILLYNS